MNNNFKSLKQEDVVSVDSDQIFVNSRTFTVDEFMTAIKQMHRQKIGELTDNKADWFSEGIDCKILKPGAKKWQRGKVRISLEFEPENLEAEESENGNLPTHQLNSPLDDIRQRIPKE